MKPIVATRTSTPNAYGFGGIWADRQRDVNDCSDVEVTVLGLVIFDRHGRRDIVEGTKPLTVVWTVGSSEETS